MPRCTSLPTPVCSAAGSMPSVATVAVISTGRSRSVAPRLTASRCYRSAPFVQACHVRCESSAVKLQKYVNVGGRAYRGTIKWCDPALDRSFRPAEVNSRQTLASATASMGPGTGYSSAFQ